MVNAPYYIARPAPGGRWAVVHALAGQHGHYAVDLDCTSLQAAEREARRLNEQRVRADVCARNEQLLAGVLRP